MASFVPVGPGGGCCVASFVPVGPVRGRAGRVFYRVSGGLVVEPGKSSPCALEMAGFRCFWACWESFVPVGPGDGCCWESFVPGEWWIGVGSGRKFSLLGGVVLEAGENSPCSVAWCWKREKILPACLKWPDFGVFGRAGRVLYRLGQGVGVAGRVLYRLSPGVAVAGRVLYRVSGGLVLEAGENSPCSREMAGFWCFWACWESFVPVGPGGGCCRESFVPVGPVRGARWGGGFVVWSPASPEISR